MCQVSCLGFSFILMGAAPRQQQKDSAVHQRSTQAESKAAPRLMPQPVPKPPPPRADDRVANITWWLALWTAVLMGVGAAQAGLFLWQLILINRSLKDAKKSADAADKAASAATKSADVAEATLTRLERPYVFVTFPPQELFETRMSAESLRMGAQLKLREEKAIYFTLRNYGRTPAIIKEIKTLAELYNPLKPAQSFEEPYRVMWGAVETAVPANGRETAPIKRELPSNVAENIRLVGARGAGPEQADLFFTVFVRYGEIFSDEEHITETPFHFNVTTYGFVEMPSSERRPNQRT